MKLLLKICLFLLWPFFATAQSQQKKLDRLNALSKTAANDTIKMTVLDSLLIYYSESNRDSALIFTEQALGLTDKLNQPLWKAKFLLNKSYFLYQKGDLPLAFRLTNEALSLAQNQRNEKICTSDVQISLQTNLINTG